MRAWRPRRSAALAAVWLALWAGDMAGLPAAGPARAAPADSAAPPGQTDDSEDAPITVVVTRHVRPGCASAFEALMSDTFRAVDRMPGHISTDFLRPTEPGGTAYKIIFKFDRPAHYRQWLESPERALWLERTSRFTEGEPQFEYQQGLEGWVALPASTGGHPPEKYKTVAVSWLAIFPLALGVSTALAPVTAGLSPVVTTAMLTGIVVPTQGFAVTPLMSWLFRDWLTPPAPVCQAE